MRQLLSLSAIILSVSLSLADPPKLTIPAELRPSGQYVIHVPETDAVAVTYVGLSGIDPVPPVMLNDKRAFVLDAFGKPAATYRFAAVAAGKDGEQTRRDFAVVIGGTTVPPITPPVTPPVTPPTTPPTPTAGLYFLIVRPDGPALPDFTAYMGNEGWEVLRKAGHAVKDKTVSEAAALGVAIPPGTVLPAVVTLRVSADGKSSKVVAGPRPLPAPADIVRLPEGVN